MSPSRPMPASPARRNGRSVSQRSFQASQARLPHLLLQPDLPEGHQVLWSQIYGLGADVVIPRLEGAPRDDVDTNAKEFLKILEQADMARREAPGSKSTSRPTPLPGEASGGANRDRFRATPGQGEPISVQLNG